MGKWCFVKLKSKQKANIPLHNSPAPRGNVRRRTHPTLSHTTWVRVRPPFCRGKPAQKRLLEAVQKELPRNISQANSHTHTAAWLWLKKPVPKWVALVSGNMDQNLSCLILTHTHTHDCTGMHRIIYTHEVPLSFPSWRKRSGMSLFH